MRVSIQNTTTRAKAVKLGRGTTVIIPHKATVVATFLAPPSKESYEKMVESGLVFEVAEVLGDTLSETLAAATNPESVAPPTTPPVTPPPPAPVVPTAPPVTPEPAAWQKGLKK